MALITMKPNEHVINDAIHATCKIAYDIEDLLARGPQQLESYCSLLLILKDVKRGVSIKESTEIRGTQVCPPGMSSSEQCNGITCQSCWQEYTKAYIKRIQEREQEK